MNSPAITAAAAGTWELGDLQVRLARTLHQAPNVLAIPGTGDPGHLAENAAAGLRLNPEDLALLDK